MTTSSVLNKDDLCYKILVLTTEIDGHFDLREKEVITEYFGIEMIEEGRFSSILEHIKTIPSRDYEDHLKTSTLEFVKLATLKEREKLILFMLKLIKADNVILPQESFAFTLVYNILNTNKKQ